MPLLQSGNDFNDWFHDHGLPVITTAFLTIILLWLVRRLLRIALKPAVERRMQGRPDIEVERRIDTLYRAIITTTQVIVIFIAVLTILPEFSIDIRPLLAGVGVTSLALTLGAQSLVRDALNGMFILSEDQFAKGDTVTIAGVTGTVEDVTLRRTVVRDVDGVVHSIPNSAVVVASNFTRDFAKVRVNVPVHVTSNLVEVRRIADDVGRDLAADPDYRELILTPPRFLRVDSVDMNGMSVQVNGTVKPGSQWEVAGILRARLLEAFQAANIKTPWG
jgi:small conductance mechanosensitive channel